MCRVGPLVQVSLFCWLCWYGTLDLCWLVPALQLQALSLPAVGSWLPVRLSCRSWWSRSTLWWLTRNVNGKDRHRLWKLAWVFESRNFPLPGLLCRKNIRRYRFRFIVSLSVLTCVFYVLQIQYKDWTCISEFDFAWTCVLGIVSSVLIFFFLMFKC